MCSSLQRRLFGAWDFCLAYHWRCLAELSVAFLGHSCVNQRRRILTHDPNWNHRISEAGCHGVSNNLMQTQRMEAIYLFGTCTNDDSEYTAALPRATVNYGTSVLRIGSRNAEVSPSTKQPPSHLPAYRMHTM